MKFDLLKRFAAAAVFLTTATSHAQEAGVSMKLDLVAWGADIPGISLKSGGKSGAATALGFRYSKPVTYAGPQVLEIHQDPAAAKAAAADGAQNPAPIPPELLKRREKDSSIVALANLPANSKRATVLIAPAAGGTYQTFVIDDDPSKLPMGQLRVHNYSPFKVALRFNNKVSKELAVKESFMVPPNNGRVIYELSYLEKGQWENQENNIISVPKDQQVQFIVLKSDDDYFKNSDGTKSGFLQTVLLRRSNEPEADAEPAP